MARGCLRHEAAVKDGGAEIKRRPVGVGRGAPSLPTNLTSGPMEEKMAAPGCSWRTTANHAEVWYTMGRSSPLAPSNHISATGPYLHVASSGTVKQGKHGCTVQLGRGGPVGSVKGREAPSRVGMAIAQGKAPWRSLG